MDKPIPPVYQEHYGIDDWGAGYFTVNEKGHIAVNAANRKGDLFELINSLVQQGVEPPIIIRFNDIIKERINLIYSAFNHAINERNYSGDYKLAYPIKANPQRHLIDLILKEGAKFSVSLEVGSKPELLSTIISDEEQNKNSLLICNGYKDKEYIEIALLAKKLGRKVIIVIEQLHELDLILNVSKNLDVEAEIGLRFRPSSQGCGRWKSSGGEFSKFGLSSGEILSFLEKLKQHRSLHLLKLFHFHAGSQITSIELLKGILQEAARMYVEVATICPSLGIFDVGGGLGIDYDGSNSTGDYSLNYSVSEYAKEIVSAIAEACQTADIPEPMIMTETGRALVAHHSALIMEVTNVASMSGGIKFTHANDIDHDLYKKLYTLYQEASGENFSQDILNKAIKQKECIVTSFIHNELSLRERAHCESLFQQIVTKLFIASKQKGNVTEEMAQANRDFLEMYFCNFSLFQSLPDYWAMGQLFPIAPIHRLLETPTKAAVIADLTCDSDGKIDCFIGRHGVANDSITLHEINPNVPYYLGVFLVGAYQEILGDLHNLFGDTNVIHVDLNAQGEWEVEEIVEGDSIENVLQYFQYRPDSILEAVRVALQSGLKAGKLSNEESAKILKRIKHALKGYTYLVIRP